MKKKNEIENHKVETTLAQSWGVYNLYNQKMETPAVFFHLPTQAGVWLSISTRFGAPLTTIYLFWILFSVTF